MLSFALDGLWLVGAIAAAFFIGALGSQYIKDTLKGVPSALRTALSATETQAVTLVSAAQAKAVADVVALVQQGKVVAAAPKPAVAAVPAAPAAPAAPAPQA